MIPRYFCTLFDRNYLLKGVAMLRSLHRVCPQARVFVLCMDAQTREVLGALQLPGVVLYNLAELESDDLLAVKGDRTVAEYCWTLSPCLPTFVLERHPEVDFLTYIDADLLFYSSIDPLFEEIGTASVAIIEHRFTPRLRHLEANGRFCVEWVSFRRDEEGLACLARWRAQCIEWCYYRLEEGRLGDQKYLDEWPTRYRHVHILQHLGAGVAPWNFDQYAYSVDAQGQIRVNDDPLIFYHFHQFQLLENGRFDRLSAFYTVERPEPDAVYSAYETQLQDVLVLVRGVSPGFAAGLKPAAQVAGRRWVQRFLPRRVKEVLRRFIPG